MNWSKADLFGLRFTASAENRRRKWGMVVVLLAAAASVVVSQLRRAPARQGVETLRGAAALEHLKQSAQYDSLEEALRQARFGVSRAEQTPLGRAAWQAPNPAAGYDAYVTETGVSLALKESGLVSLRLQAMGYGAQMRTVEPGQVRGDQQTITIERENLHEWFVNGANGLEHGFTLSGPPGRRIGKMTLRLALRVGDGWRATGGENSKQVVLRNGDGHAVKYGKLAVNDSAGRDIKARLTVADEQVVIEVEDHDAVYPLTIDPLFTLQQRLTAADGASNDYLGYAVALDGDTAVIGAPYDDDTRGSAYVFVRSGTTWALQTRLTANDGALNDYFGWSVAIKGDTALVGAIYGPGNADADQGAAYVFVRGSASWTLQKKLIADDGQAFAQFGTAVALDGDTALIGAPDHQRPPFSLKTGAAYVFTRGGASWAQQAKLLADDGDGGDQFGAAVAVEGDTALIGAPNNAVTVAGQGAAYIFTRAGTNWMQQPLLTTSPAAANANFGNAVALSGENALIGASQFGSDDRGTVYSYRRFVKLWSLTGQFFAPNPAVDGHFGVSVALSGDTAIVGAALGLFQPGEDQRSAYAFVYSGTWNYVRQFGTDLGSARDGFGHAVAISGNTVLVGAYRADVGNEPSFGDQGAAYAFVLHDSRHVEQPPKLTAFDGARSDFFGRVLTLEGNTLAVGAPYDDVGTNEDQGSVYIFARNGAGWTFQQKVSAPAGAPYDNFGHSVALSGDTLIAGAPGASFNGQVRQGFVYVFVRNGTTWAFQQKLWANDGAARDHFGRAVAVKGETVAIGANQAKIGINSLQGAAYIFTRAGTTWTQRQKLTAVDGAASDLFGWSLAMDGNTLVVGAVEDDINANTDQGSAYVFVYNGSNWMFRQKLLATDGGARDFFGESVTVSGDTIAVGAPKHQVGGNLGQGTVYVFNRSDLIWTQQPPITAGDGGAMDVFGHSVALSGSVLVVGAYGDSIGINSSQGSAYVFTRIGTWFEQQKLTAADGEPGDYFGLAVAISGDTLAIAADNDNIAANADQGSVYTFAAPRGCPAIAVAPATLNLPDGSPGVAYNQPLTAAGGGVGEYHFAVTRGALPPGIVVLGDQGLVGTPTVPGTYRFTVTATYYFSLCTGSREYVITILPCPTIAISPNALSPGVVGKTYNRTLTAGGIPGPHSFTVTTGALPPGVSLSFAGALTGTPTQAGSYNFTVTASASGCSNNKSYTLTILPTCPTITVSPATLPSGTLGTPYNQSITVTGGVEPYLIAISVPVGGDNPLPPGINFTQGGFVGTPTQTGTYPITMVFRDANQCEISRVYTININAACPPLTLNPTELTSGTIDVPYNELFTLTGGTGIRLFSVTSGSLPPGLTLAQNGVLSGTPHGIGGFNFTVTAAANGCNVMRAYTLEIDCPNIVITPAALPAATVGTAYSQTLTATGGSGPQSFAVLAGTLPPGLSLSAQGILSGTPTQAGIYNFDIGVSSNTCLITDDYTLMVGGGNDGLQFYPLPKPLRLLDTRPGQSGCDAPGAQIPGNTSRTQLARRTCDGVTIPTNAMAVTGNVTTVQSGGGYLTLYPSNAQQPLVANSNYAANEIVNNVFTVGLGGDGAFKIFVTSNTDVVVDITGYYAPPPTIGSGGLYFHPLPNPIRLLETRPGFTGTFTPGAKLTANADTPQQARVAYDGVTIPATALAIVGNATTLNGGAGYLTLYPGGVARPLAAGSNFSDGQVMNAPFTVGLSASGEFNIFTTTGIDLIIDVLGYYSAEAADANGAGLLFKPLATPVRLLETRAGFAGCFTPGAPLVMGSTRQQQARGACGGQTIAAGALAIVGNATVINNQAGYLTFWPNGAARPLVASSNFAAGQVLNRHFTVGLSATGVFNIFASAQTDLIVDVSGFFAP